MTPRVRWTTRHLPRQPSVVANALHILRLGGRYGIHELCVILDNLPREQKQAIDHALSWACTTPCSDVMTRMSLAATLTICFTKCGR